MNLAHMLNNSDHTQPRGVNIPEQTAVVETEPWRTERSSVTQLRIASDALTLERVAGHLEEITAHNIDSAEAVDVIVAVPAITWASQAGPEISRLMATAAQMSLSIRQRGITHRRIRWWLCVDLEQASETVLTAVRVAGVSALRQMDPVAGVVGTLVLMGDPGPSGEALHHCVADANWEGSCLVDLTAEVSPEGKVTANVVAVSSRNAGSSVADHPTVHHEHLETSRGDLHTELELVHGTLAQLNGQLRSVKGEFVEQRAQLTEVREQYSSTSQELVSYRNELVSLKSELSVRHSQVAVLSDQVTALQRELEYLEVHRTTLTKDLETERSAVRTAQDEVALQLAAAEQMRSAATRAEIEHSLQRAATEELQVQALDAEHRLQRTQNALALAQESLLAFEAVVAERGQEIERLEQQRTRMKSDVERFERAMVARLDPLKKELSELHERHDDAVTALNAVIAERQMLVAAQDALLSAGEAEEFSEARALRDYLHREGLMMRATRDHAELELNEVLTEFAQLQEQSHQEEMRWTQLHTDGMARHQELSALNEELVNANRDLKAQNLAAQEVLESVQGELKMARNAIADDQKRLEDRLGSLEVEVAQGVEARWRELLSASRSERKRMLRSLRATSDRS
jgi:chromosome segregation ATPase